MKNNEKILRQRSKFLSLVLRHESETISIKLDSEGWTDVQTLLSPMIKHKNPLKMKELIEVIFTNEKSVFNFQKIKI